MIDNPAVSVGQEPGEEAGRNPFWRYVFGPGSEEWTDQQKIERIRHVRRTETFSMHRSQRYRNPSKKQITRNARPNMVHMKGCERCGKYITLLTNIKIGALAIMPALNFVLGEHHTSITIQQACDPANLTCVYVRCSNPAGHLVKVCKELNHACSGCRMRGHFRANCPVPTFAGTADVNNRAQISQALEQCRADFEQYANLHVNGSRRFENIYLGAFYYCFKHYEKHLPPWTYQCTLERSANFVRTKIEAYAQPPPHSDAIRNQVAMNNGELPVEILPAPGAAAAAAPQLPPPAAEASADDLDEGFLADPDDDNPDGQ